MTSRLPPTMPAPGTPGWRLCSPRAIQALVALQHAADGATHCRVTVDEMAAACGCTRNTVATAIAEMQDLAWIRRSDQRDAQGRHAGIAITLLVRRPS